MIKVIVYNKENQQIFNQSFPFQTIRIGRHSTNEVCLTDPYLSRHCAQIVFEDGILSFETNFTRTRINATGDFVVGPYRIRVINLRALDDEVTQNRIIPKPHLRPWFKPIFILLTFSLTIFIQIFCFSPSENPTLKALQNIAVIDFSIFMAALCLSILSRALNGHFHFLRLLQTVTLFTILMSILSLDLLGLRWLLGPWLEYKPLYQLFYNLCGLFLLFFLSEIIIQQIKKRVRLSILFFIFLISLYFNYNRFIPMTSFDQQVYAEIENPPMLYPGFMPSPQTMDQFLSEFSTHSQKLTQKANNLKRTMTYLN